MSLLSKILNKKTIYFLYKALAILVVLVVVFVIALDIWLLHKLSQKKISTPASVYARPLELFIGANVSKATIVNELYALEYKRGDTAKVGFFDYFGGRVVINHRSFKFWDGEQQEQIITVDFRRNKITGLSSSVSDDSSIMLRMEPVKIGYIYPERFEDRLLVNIEDVPQFLIDSLVSVEDKKFYDHYGISLKSIIRALIANIKNGRIVEGGSTITQQLIKNFFLSPDQTYVRKAIEAIMAILLEFHLSKNEILEAYINEIFIIQDGIKSVHGFGLASHYLYGKPLHEIDISQSAMLVAMVKGPSYYDPVNNPQRALKRRNLVLKIMHTDGKITDSQYKAAVATPLNVSDNLGATRIYHSYIDLVRQQLRENYNQRDLTTKGLNIFTNMDLTWQHKAEHALRSGIKRIEAGYNDKNIEGAVVIVDRASASVLAIVGNKMMRSAGFNRAINARRQIGSIIKPAVYLAALEHKYTLVDTISDSPLTVKIKDQIWKPLNYDEKFHGDVPLYLALAKSYNVSTARLGLAVGIDKVINVLHRLGIEREIKDLPSLTLGALDLSVLEVAQMYRTMADNGFYAKLSSIREVTDREGNALKRYPLQLEQRFTSSNIYLLNYALQEVIRSGTGKSLAKLALNGFIAGKTGTSNAYRDSWFAGYDSSKLAVVWLGKDDNSSLPVSGASGALPIWKNIIDSNVVLNHTNIVPDDIKYIWVDKISGKLVDRYCANSIYIPVIRGTEFGLEVSVSCDANYLR